jgi:hypothetical protein
MIDLLRFERKESCAAFVRCYVRISAALLLVYRRQNGKHSSIFVERSLLCLVFSSSVPTSDTLFPIATAVTSVSVDLL